MARISWEAFAERLGRLRGFTFPVIGGGLSWAPADDEKKVAEKILTYLEDQGIFSAPFEWEHPKETYAAAGIVRAELTKQMQELRHDMKSYLNFKSIRSALRSFQRSVRAQGLTERESKSTMTNEEISSYDCTLVKLRNEAAVQIAQIYVACKMKGKSELMNWIRG